MLAFQQGLSLQPAALLGTAPASGPEAQAANVFGVIYLDGYTDEKRQPDFPLTSLAVDAADDDQ